VGDLLPLFPLGTVLLPGAPLPLHVFEERYRELVRDLTAAGEPRSFGVVAIKRGSEVGDEPPELYDVGCIAVVRAVEAYPDGRYDLDTMGGARFRIDAFDTSLPYLRAYVSVLDEDEGDHVETAATGTLAALTAYEDVLRTMLDTTATFPTPSGDPHELSYLAARILQIDPADKQRLLECRSDAERLVAATRLLRRESGLLSHVAAAPGDRLTAGPFSLN
jgi:Lon protease-like protein